MAVTVLLDTHALLWSLLEPDKLSSTALATIKDPQTVLLVSSTSAWELSIKHKLGKLASASSVLNNFSGHLERLQANTLSITPDHALVAGALPLHHRDPFDRMLIAQAQFEDIPIITNDKAFSTYEVKLLW
ncbi:MAG: type II toxin-antitoxin system VapC family toxin [Deinococcota bacterium]